MSAAVSSMVAEDAARLTACKSGPWSHRRALPIHPVPVRPLACGSHLTFLLSKLPNIPQRETICHPSFCLSNYAVSGLRQTGPV